MREPSSERSRVRRSPDRGHYDDDTVNAILDASLLCHVGFVDGGHPHVIPTLQVRLGDRLFLHGATGSRMIKVLSDGAPACVTVTMLDGLVLARSAFHQSVNYRSVVVFGTAELVTDERAKTDVLHALTEKFQSGRWDDIRHPTPGELARTAVVALPLDEASAKVRTGGPKDDEDDYALPIWAGVVPLELTRLEPVSDENGVADPS